MATKVIDTRDMQKGPKMPERQTTLHVEYTDPLTGLLYAGDFTVKHLNLREIGQVGVARARLNGGVNPSSLDPRIDQLHSMLAHLAVAIVKAPEWWKPEEFYTSDVVELVFQKVMDFEYSFRRPAGQRSEGAEADSSGEPETARDPDKKVVDAEVQTSANL